jgi:hypothetical protein
MVFVPLSFKLIGKDESRKPTHKRKQSVFITTRA